MYVRRGKLDTYHSLRSIELDLLSPGFARDRRHDRKKSKKFGIEGTRDE